MNPKLTADLDIDPDIVRRKLAGFIRTGITGSGRSRAVLGLSGGLDSALVCHLCVEALGARNVLAVRMPYRTSSPASLEHAGLVIHALGVQTLTVEITPMVDPLINAFPDMSPVRKGNIMARQRMIILYDQSEAFNGLVVGSGNKTESLLGYTTLYGDSACALNPIGDLYKTQVRQLARAMGVPEVIITKPPTADLWPGQTDEGDLGFTYNEVDRLLYLLYDKQHTPLECVKAGFSEKFVSSVIDRIQRNEFKRRLPPIARLG